MPQIRVNCTRNKTSKGVKTKVSSELGWGNTPVSGTRMLLAFRGTCCSPPWGTTPTDPTPLRERALWTVLPGGRGQLAASVGAVPQRWEKGESCPTSCVLPLEELNHSMVVVHICLLWPAGPPSSFFPSTCSISKISNSTWKHQEVLLMIFKAGV